MSATPGDRREHNAGTSAIVPAVTNAIFRGNRQALAKAVNPHRRVEAAGVNVQGTDADVVFIDPQNGVPSERQSLERRLLLPVSKDTLAPAYTSL
jgi:hypothetical protein